jgi:hypothetical protein
MVDTVLPQRITGRKLLGVLIEAGIIPHYTTRAVIDVAVDSAVVVYVELFGDERLLQVATTLDGIEIRGVPAPDA